MTPYMNIMSFLLNCVGDILCLIYHDVLLFHVPRPSLQILQIELSCLNLRANYVFLNFVKYLATTSNSFSIKG